jgi:hypothetical protein
MSSGSGSYFQKVPVSDPTFFLTKYDFKGPKMAFRNMIFKEYLNFLYKNGKTMKLLPFLMLFVNVYIHFRILTRIRNPLVPDPAKVPDPCGSGSTTLNVTLCPVSESLVPPESCFQLGTWFSCMPNCMKYQFIQLTTYSSFPLSEDYETDLESLDTAKPCFNQKN